MFDFRDLHIGEKVLFTYHEEGGLQSGVCKVVSIHPNHVNVQFEDGTELFIDDWNKDMFSEL